MIRRPGRGGSILAVVVLLGCAMRANNALRYPALYGFDAREGNWPYIRALSRSWRLPEPDAGWSTSHPPLFYYLGAALNRLAQAFDLDAGILLARLLSTAAGLGVVWLAVSLVQRVDGANERRRLLAAGLLLFLPAHLMISAMVHEELVAAFFTSLAVVLAARTLAGGARDSLSRAAGVGLAGGLSLLTKLSGATAVASTAAAYAIAGWRRGRGRRALRCVGALLVAAALSGGWYYGRNLVKRGFAYPHALPAHRIMFSMPPGERSPLDYLRVPLETLTDPQLLDPALLRSVWGSTYATLWFDGHRFFLPLRSEAVRRLGSLILLLALLPSAAFAVGLWRGARRALQPAGAIDLTLVLLVASTFLGYAFFTWRNPWYATLKGTYLLGLCVPFSFYTSEVLADWTRGRGMRAVAVWSLLALLAAAVALAFTYGLVFEKPELPGLRWLQPRP